MKTLCLSLIGAFGLAILGLAIWLGTRWYGKIEVVQTIFMLNSQDEVFIFINHNNAILTETRIQLMAKQVASVPNIPEHVSDDLLAVHFGGGKISKYDLKDFGSGGSPFVYHGDIYWSRGRERADLGPTKWKWNGSKFSPLSEAEASLLDYSHIKDIDEATKQGGWNEKNFMLGGRESDVTVRLRNENVKIYADSKNAANARERLLFVESANTNAPQTLIDIAKGYQTITRGEYLQLKDKMVSKQGSVVR